MTEPDSQGEPTPSGSYAAARADLERKSTEELFALTLKGDYEREDDDLSHLATITLRLRGTAEVFEMAKKFCESENARERAEGLNVLSQLGSGKPDSERPYMTECVDIAIAHLDDADQHVVSAAAWVLSWQATKRGVDELFGLRSHPNSDVRLAVACSKAIGHPKSTQILIELMQDYDDDVRNWATFFLASGDDFQNGEWHYPDSPEIRAALHLRLTDSFEEARREAIWGLATRKDPAGLKLLLGYLESEKWWSGDEDAAQETLMLPAGTPVEELCKGLRQLISTLEA